ncbi:competence type IV pilus ATPase ComGA [Metasolibacillus meyeri]|uniref:Competence type IV pilus ATPase ComGA n=1 Tax=Metasolibacillus meyeri TaxID=1071052 RepID=A0AAW9NYW8_9BACL|nr:competence type IV pilus ATPase ComGA [Metasolibacillus meyeri]MEC1180083.1 competence type IV pilus ATPase ComGA [Metasolibacillus meyeri]
METESIVVRRSEQLIEEALAFSASDIHLSPANGCYSIVFRKYGKMYVKGELPQELATRIITYYKFLSALDISEKRKPQSGAFQKEIAQTVYAFRISTLPSVLGKESLIIRILEQNITLPFIELSYDAAMAGKIEQLVQHRQGMLLFCGATGSGKSTSLYSLIHYCCTVLKRHVISLEDPVEKNYEQIVQIQVNERAGVTYAEGLRAILRHSPDVIMIGEIRDTETAKIAVQAALSGHLVLSTVHAKNTVNCLYRLMDLGISLDELRQATVGIIAQMLIETGIEDERKAIFELLSDVQLYEAFSALAHSKVYSLQYQHTLEHQRYLLEGQSYANFTHS